MQGICPLGWHLPSDNEWCELLTFLNPSIDCGATGGQGIDAGGQLKEVGILHWISPNTGATNLSGFTGLPGGYRFVISGDFDELNNNFFICSNPYQ